MSDKPRMVVTCAHGDDEPDKVVVAYLVAGAALDQGKDVVLFLTGEGVRLATKGYVAPIREGKEPPVQRVHDQFIEKGGTFFVCPICFNDRGLEEDSLVESCEIKGATPLLEWAGDAQIYNA